MKKLVVIVLSVTIFVAICGWLWTNHIWWTKIDDSRMIHIGECREISGRERKHQDNGTACYPFEEDMGTINNISGKNQCCIY